MNRIAPRITQKVVVHGGQARVRCVGIGNDVSGCQSNWLLQNITFRILRNPGIALFIDPPSMEIWELWDFLKQKVLGLKELEMDSYVLKLSIVHERVLIH